MFRCGEFGAGLRCRGVVRDARKSLILKDIFFLNDTISFANDRF